MEMGLCDSCRYFYAEQLVKEGDGEDKEMPVYELTV